MAQWNHKRNHLGIFGGSHRWRVGGGTCFLGRGILERSETGGIYLSRAKTKTPECPRPPVFR